MLTQSPHRLGANAGRNSVNGFCIAAATILRWRWGGGGQRGMKEWREEQGEGGGGMAFAKSQQTQTKKYTINKCG